MLHFLDGFSVRMKLWSVLLYWYHESLAWIPYLTQVSFNEIARFVQVSDCTFLILLKAEGDQISAKWIHTFFQNLTMIYYNLKTFLGQKYLCKYVRQQTMNHQCFLCFKDGKLIMPPLWEDVLGFLLWNSEDQHTLHLPINGPVNVTWKCKKTYHTTRGTEHACALKCSLWGEHNTEDQCYMRTFRWNVFVFFWNLP